MSYVGAVARVSNQMLEPQEAETPVPTGSFQGRAVHQIVCDFIADLAERIGRLWEAIVHFVISIISPSEPVEEWNHYLQSHCEKVDFNGDLNKIRLFFLGDTHTDTQQIPVRERITHHYAFAGGAGINRVFTEGLDKDFPQKIESKDFIVESWEVAEHFEEISRVDNQIAALHKETKEGLDKLKKVKEKSLILPKEEIISLIQHIKDVQQRQETLLKRSQELYSIRNQDLIQKVQNTLQQSQSEKIFVIGGEHHLENSGYKVTDAFKAIPWALFIPKTSEQGQQNIEQFSENLIARGSYDEAYVGLI